TVRRATVGVLWDEAMAGCLVGAARLDRRAPARGDPLAILGVQRVHPAVSQRVAVCQAHDGFAGRVDVEALALFTGDEDPQRRGVAHRAEASLRGMQRAVD